MIKLLNVMVLHIVDGFLVTELYFYLITVGLEGRDSQTIPVHVVNIEIQDNHEEATIGAFLMCELVSMVNISVTLGILIYNKTY